MKVTFAIFFCVILGLTTAKHLLDEEYQGFETAEDLSLARRQKDTQYDDPEEMMRKMLHDLAEGLKNLAECLKGGISKKHQCFEEFKKSTKIPAKGRKCVGEFDKCIGDDPKRFLSCEEEFGKCLHHNKVVA